MRPISFAMLPLSYISKLKSVFTQAKNICFLVIVRKVIIVKNLCVKSFKQISLKELTVEGHDL